MVIDHIPGPYRIQLEREHDWSVYQPNGTIVARCASEKTAGLCANALNACAVLPILISGVRSDG